MDSPKYKVVDIVSDSPDDAKDLPVKTGGWSSIEQSKPTGRAVGPELRDECLCCGSEIRGASLRGQLLALVSNFLTSFLSVVRGSSLRSRDVEGREYLFHKTRLSPSVVVTSRRGFVPYRTLGRQAAPRRCDSQEWYHRRWSMDRSRQDQDWSGVVKVAPMQISLETGRGATQAVSRCEQQSVESVTTSGWAHLQLT